MLSRVLVPHTPKTENSRWGSYESTNIQLYKFGMKIIIVLKHLESMLGLKLNGVIKRVEYEAPFCCTNVSSVTLSDSSKHSDVCKITVSLLVF
jgi:hypothetical protein